MRSMLRMELENRRPVPQLLGVQCAQFVVDAMCSPRQLFFYRPQMVRLEPLNERLGPQGPVRIERVVGNCCRSGRSALRFACPSR